MRVSTLQQSVPRQNEHELPAAHTPNPYDVGRMRHRESRINHWDAIARQMDSWRGLGGNYHQRIADVYRFLVAPGQRVLEIGCAQGDLLSAVSPSVGVGIEFSPEMVRRAAQRHPRLQFVQADTHDFTFNQPFDVIILSDLINDLWDVQTVFQQLATLCHSGTRLILNTYSRLWEAPLGFAERLGLAKPTLHQNWLTVEDVANLLKLADFEVIRCWEEYLWPLATPGLSTIANHVLVKLPPFSSLALSNFIVARPRPSHARSDEPRVSVIIPARNEAGNIEQIFARVPAMGSGTELIFVEGHSKDDTYAAIECAIAAHQDRPSRLLRQTGVGKGDAS
jgi:SAM-dependent methyltransferase